MNNDNVDDREENTLLRLSSCTQVPVDYVLRSAVVELENMHGYRVESTDVFITSVISKHKRQNPAAEDSSSNCGAGIEGYLHQFVDITSTVPVLPSSTRNKRPLDVVDLTVEESPPMKKQSHSSVQTVIDLTTGGKRSRRKKTFKTKQKEGVETEKLNCFHFV